jgi:hypothetical protein
MFRHARALAVLVMALLTPSTGMTDESPVLVLTPKLRAALVAEMAGLKTAIAELSVALASGEWGEAAARAERIRDSYILKQKLSRAERETLERTLPAEFRALDERFHRHAANLAHAACMQDHELAVFYLAKLQEGCGGCHARYATHTFRGFVPAPEQPHAH